MEKTPDSNIDPRALSPLGRTRAKKQNIKNKIDSKKKPKAKVFIPVFL